MDPYKFKGHISWQILLLYSKSKGLPFYGLIISLYDIIQNDYILIF